MSVDAPTRESGVARYNGVCRACSTPVSRLLEGVWVSAPKTVGCGMYARKTTVRTFSAQSQGAVELSNGCATTKCQCGRTVALKRVDGVYKSDVPCDARCTTAKGHNCECQCGGTNHGADNG